MKYKVSGAIAIPKASWGCAPALPNQFRVVFLGAIQSVSHETLHQNRMTASNEPQANKKFFGAAVFQKCCRGVGEQPTFAEQIKLAQSMQQKSKSKSKESQLPSNKKGCSEIQGFRGNCDSQASWGCAPALPNRIRVVFLKTMFCMKQWKNDS